MFGLELNVFFITLLFKFNCLMTMVQICNEMGRLHGLDKIRPRLDLVRHCPAPCHSVDVYIKTKFSVSIFRVIFWLVSSINRLKVMIN